MGQARAWFLLLVVLATGCKQPGGRASPPEPPAAGEEAAPEPPPAPESECRMESFDEAQRRHEVFLMKPIMSGMRLQSELSAYIEGVRDAARRRQPGEMDSIVERAWKALASHRPETSGDERKLLEAVARSRTEAYATCMGIAEDDPTWCGKEEQCLVMYGIYRGIALQAVLGQKPCEEAMEVGPEASGMTLEIWTRACHAIKNMDPDACPDSLPERAGVVCRAASTRNPDHCEPLFDKGEHARECCERFAWRLGSVLRGKAVPRYIPEQAALGGDVDGCERALVWGLFRDAASTFGVPGAPDPPWQDRPTDEYVCPFIVYHSLEELPGEME